MITSASQWIWKSLLRLLRYSLTEVNKTRRICYGSPHRIRTIDILCGLKAGDSRLYLVGTWFTWESNLSHPHKGCPPFYIESSIIQLTTTFKYVVKFPSNILGWFWVYTYRLSSKYIFHQWISELKKELRLISPPSRAILYGALGKTDHSPFW